MDISDVAIDTPRAAAIDRGLAVNALRIDLERQPLPGLVVYWWLLFVAVSAEEAADALHFVLCGADGSQHCDQLVHRVGQTVHGRSQWVDRRRERLYDLDVPLDRSGRVLDRLNRVEDVRFDIARLMHRLDDVLFGPAENRSDWPGDEVEHG